MWQSGNNEIFVEICTALRNAKKYGVTLLMVSAQSGKMQVIHYLTEIAANLRIMQFISSHICKDGIYT